MIIGIALSPETVSSDVFHECIVRVGRSEEKGLDEVGSSSIRFLLTTIKIEWLHNLTRNTPIDAARLVEDTGRELSCTKLGHMHI